MPDQKSTLCQADNTRSEPLLDSFDIVCMCVCLLPLSLAFWHRGQVDRYPGDAQHHRSRVKVTRSKKNVCTVVSIACFLALRCIDVASDEATEEYDMECFNS